MVLPNWVVRAGFVLLTAVPLFAQNAYLRTSTDAERWKNAGMVDSSAWASTNSYVEILPQTEYQTVMGWGGTIQEKQWESMKILSAAGQDSIMRELFDTSGCNIDYLRCPIGCCDFDINEAPISLNETANDYEMKNFSLHRDSTRKIPLIKMAQAINPKIRFWGCPWSPPKWMHDNGKFDSGKMKTDAQTQTAYALYLEKFVQGYKEAGINIEWITCQNEPEISDGGYPKCGWTNTQERDFYKNYLIPRFKQSSLTTRILLGVFCNGPYDTWVKTIMDDATIRDFVGFTSHSYQSPDWGIKATTDYPGIPFMQSEAPFGWPPENLTQNWNEGCDIFNNVADFMNNRTSVYTVWNMVNDERAMSGFDWIQMVMIQVNRNTKKVTYNPYFWAYKHFANYVKGGAKAVKYTVTGTGPAKTNAFVNPNGDVILVCMNTGNATTLNVKLGNRMWKAPLPAKSFNTLRIASGATVGTKQLVVEKRSIPALHDAQIANSTLRFALSAAASGAQEMDLTLNDLQGRTVWTGHRGGSSATLGELHTVALRSEKGAFLPGMYLLTARIKNSTGKVMTVQNRVRAVN